MSARDKEFVLGLVLTDRPLGIPDLFKSGSYISVVDRMRSRPLQDVCFSYSVELQPDAKSLARAQVTAPIGTLPNY